MSIYNVANLHMVANTDLLPGSTTLRNDLQFGKYEYFDTNPGGYNAAAGKMTVDFEFISNNFFSVNPDAHIPVVLRTSIAIRTSVCGQGISIGSLAVATVKPTIVIESFRGSTNYLWGASQTPSPLLDNVRYRINIESVVNSDGTKQIRYRVWCKSFEVNILGNIFNMWKIINDSGYVSDNNITDLTQSGLVFGYIFTNANNTNWSVDITNCKVIWGPV